MNKAVLVVCVLALLAGVASASQMGVSRVTPARQPVGLDLCPTCVSFTAQAIDQLLNIIANVGILGGCADLCGKLPQKIEAEVCNVLCDIVGIEEFVKFIEKADLDPIYFCQLIRICPIHDGGSAKITAVTVSPPSGPQGTTFLIQMAFSVFNQTGTGEIVINILPPDAQPFGDGELNEGFAPGNYSIRFQLQAQPSEQEPFSPGTYKVELAICNGECGSSHPHSQVFDTKTTTFQITQ